MATPSVELSEQVSGCMYKQETIAAMKYEATKQFRTLNVVSQSYMLSLDLITLYADYIVRNVKLELKFM